MSQKTDFYRVTRCTKDADGRRRTEVVSEKAFTLQEAREDIQRDFEKVYPIRRFVMTGWDAAKYVFTAAGYFTTVWEIEKYNIDHVRVQAKLDAALEEIARLRAYLYSDKFSENTNVDVRDVDRRLLAIQSELL